MANAQLYEKLAKHLDQGIMGAPMSPALMGILEILFPDDEAEIAVRLPMQNRSLSELKEIYPDLPNLEAKLNRMVARGTVFTSQKAGQERKYRLLPSVVGWAETPYWGGKDTPMARKLAPLWLKYREEAFAREKARGGVPVMRVIPVSRTVQDPRTVLPFDHLKPMIEAAAYCAVAKCPCRQIKAYVGEGCDHSLENCLHFGSFGRYMVEQGMAREITAEETLGILQVANEEGLVHMADNIDGHLSTICNCCGCCCSFITAKKQMGIFAMSDSNYVSRVDPQACVGCEVCVERCPMEAVELGDEGTAVVDESRCIGCGVCTPSCEAQAVDLVLRGEVKAPPTAQEIFAARFKVAH